MLEKINLNTVPSLTRTRLRRTLGYYVQKLQSRQEWNYGARQEPPRLHDFFLTRTPKFSVRLISC